MTPGSPYGQGDSPDLANKETYEPRDGDYFVVGSDGLFDNIELQEILDVMDTVGKETAAGVMENKKEVAEELAKRAIEYGKDEGYLSPFAKEARRAGFPQHIGGKLDDTTVIVAQYFEKESRDRGQQTAEL